MVCLETPAWFGAVGQFYVDFRQTSDDEVVELLCRGARAVPVPADGSPRGDGPVDEEPGADAAAEQTGTPQTRRPARIRTDGPGNR